MRTKLLAIPVLLFMMLTSCETDFDLNTQWKDIPIVYGVLNPSSSVQSIRIQRAFLGEGNALNYAKIADSNYYDTAVIDAKLIELNNGNTFRTLKLKPVWVLRETDTTNEFYNPDFPYALVYRTEQYQYSSIDDATGDTLWLNPSHTFRIEIKNSKTGKLITATTPLVGRCTLKTPNLVSPLTINESTYNSVKWTRSGAGKRYEAILRFLYKEYHPGTHDTTLNHVDMSFGYLTAADDETEFTVKYLGSNYFKYLGNKIPANNDVKRIAYRFAVILNVIEEELKIYLEVNSPSSGFVQEKPLYTNMSDGYGIFSSANSQTFTLRINPSTITSIKNTFSSIDNSF